MTFGIHQSAKGFVVCILDERDIPLMEVSATFEDWHAAERVRRIMDSARFGGLGNDLFRELQMAEVIQPLAIGFEVRA